MGRAHCLGASGGHCSPGSTAFFWDAHPLLLLPRKVTILVLGLDNAGKTSVIMDMERGEEQHNREPASHGGSSFTLL